MNTNNYDNTMEKVAFGFGFGFGFNRKREDRIYGLKHASQIVEESFEKIAEEEEKNNTASRVGLGVGGATALGSSKNMILGKKRMYHGTSKENWESIKNEGLRADRGGAGGASAAVSNADYIKSSKGKVHLTNFKSVANGYTNVNETDMPLTTKAGKLHSKMKSYLDDGKAVRFDSPNYNNFVQASNEYQDFIKNNKKGMNKEFVKGYAKQSKNGKRIKINMDYNKFKSMEVDPDQAGVASKNKLLNKFQKNIASRGSINIAPEEIAGSSAKFKNRVKHTAKAMPGYVKGNPLRFGAGVALAGGGAYALNKALRGQEKSACEIVNEIFAK